MSNNSTPSPLPRAIQFRDPKLNSSIEVRSSASSRPSVDNQAKGLNGKILNKRWGVGAVHCLYRQTGDWYHKLKSFPGAYFDCHGYLKFSTPEDFATCTALQIHQDVHIPSGISKVPGYVKVTSSDLAIAGKESFISMRVAASHLEGRVRQVLQTRYERNVAARTACLEHYGTACAVCGLNLENRYGRIARGLIHVHHLTPLATEKKLRIVNPIRDLRPVCPNCHLVLHSQSPPHAIEALKAAMRSCAKNQK
jgi:hypothetical protein